MVERRSRHPRGRHIPVALWLLVLGLALAPNLALAAAACAPACCPAERALDDCGSGFDQRACCETAPTSLEVFAPVPVELPAPAVLPFRIDAPVLERLDVRARFAPARLALATSPLRLSVVLRI